MALMILRPPGAPTASTGRSRRRRMIGVILVTARLPGAIELAAPGSGLNQVMPLFQRMPVPAVITRAPNSPAAVIVQATAFRSPSTAARWVVQVSSAAGGAAAGAGPDGVWGSHFHGSLAGRVVAKCTQGSASAGTTEARFGSMP